MPRMRANLSYKHKNSFLVSARLADGTLESTPFHPAPLCYDNMKSLMERNIGDELALAAIARCILTTWEPVSDKMLTVKFHSRMKTTSTVQCNSPTKTYDIEENGGFQ